MISMDLNSVTGVLKRGEALGVDTETRIRESISLNQGGPRSWKRSRVIPWRLQRDTALPPLTVNFWPPEAFYHLVCGILLLQPRKKVRAISQ